MTQLNITYDNTRLSNFKRCPRFFYFRDVRHLRTEALSPPLVFGSAWGKAMDAVWETAAKGRKGANVYHTGSELYDAGMAAFTTAWTEAGMPPPDEIDKELEKELSPRTPRVAAQMLEAYIDERSQLLDEAELVGSEVSFMVPLGTDDDGVLYTGLFDKLLKRREQIICLEHKTTGQYRVNGFFKTSWLDSFSPNSQVDGYLYALARLYPDQRPAVWIDGALIHKTVQGFQIIPIEKQLAHAEAFASEALYWVQQIEHEQTVLGLCRSDDAFMKAFPKNTTGCWAFNTACPYLDLCRAWPNPIDKPTPPGFVVEPWDALTRNGNQEPMRPPAAPEVPRA